jgi:hypothetical protein
MDELLAFSVWFIVEVLLIQTGRAAVWTASFGHWRGENIAEKEGRIYGAAGALSFVRDGRRIVTANGLLFAGIFLYVVFAFALLVYVGQI